MRAPETMAGAQNSTEHGRRPTEEFWLFCHHQHHDDDHCRVFEWQNWFVKGVGWGCNGVLWVLGTFLLNVHCLLDFRLQVFVNWSVLTRAVAQVCKFDFIGWQILFYSCARFPFLSASSFSFFPPAGASLLLPVGNKLSCWHFLFAFLLCREIPRTPLQFTMEIPHTGS